MAAAGSGSLPVGYHTVDLSSPVLLSERQASGGGELTTPGTTIPSQTNIPSPAIERRQFLPGRELRQRDRRRWTDLTSVGGCTEANVCLKAFTRAGADDVVAPTTTLIPANPVRDRLLEQRTL